MLFDAFLARWRNGEHGKGADAFYWSFNYGPMHIVVLTSEHDDRSQSECDSSCLTAPENCN